MDDAPGWRVIERPQRQPRRASVMILTVAVGLLLAFAMVYRYQVGWPDHDPRVVATTAPSAARPAVRTPPESVIAKRPEPEVAEATASAGPPPATANALRIFIHYPARHGDAVPAIQLAALLQTHGFHVADIRRVDVEIERPSVRYFFLDDRARSRGLVDAIRILVADQAPDQATDFSHHGSRPPPGTVEVWLPAADRSQLALDSAS